MHTTVGLILAEATEARQRMHKMHQAILLSYLQQKPHAVRARLAMDYHRAQEVSQTWDRLAYTGDEAAFLAQARTLCHELRSGEVFERLREILEGDDE